MAGARGSRAPSLEEELLDAAQLEAIIAAAAGAHDPRGGGGGGVAA
jgi:hypothetical protein